MKKIPIFFTATIIACIHWTGIVAGGVVVGLTARNIREALAFGLVLGLATWSLFIIYLAMNGLVGKYLAMVPISYLSFCFTIVLSTLSALLKSLFDFRN